MIATDRTARRRRAGFALLLVIGFNVVLLAVWSVAYRSVGSAYRVEMARTLRRTRDDGAMTALGQGVALLEYSWPMNADGSTITSPEVYYVQLNVFTPPTTYTCYVAPSPATPPTSNYRWFAVVYTPVPFAADGTTPQTGVWSVRAYAVDHGGTPALPGPGQAFPKL
jgi:hypothetical protein